MKKMVLIFILTLIIAGTAVGAVGYVQFYEDNGGNGGDGNKQLAPTAVLEMNTSDPRVDEQIQFIANNSKPAEGVSGNLTFEWDFGDDAGSHEMWVKHTYTETGTYTVSLTVTDSKGRSETETKTIEVKHADYSETHDGEVSTTDDEATFNIPVAENATELSVQIDLTSTSDPWESPGSVTLKLVAANGTTVREENGVDENGDTTWTHTDNLESGDWSFSITSENEGSMQYSLRMSVTY